MEAVRVYAPSDVPGPLRQTEILSGLDRIRLSAASFGAPEIAVDAVHYEYAIVLTQDCDLQRDYEARELAASKGAGSDDLKIKAALLHDVLLCQVFAAEELRLTPAINSTIWHNVRNNKNERYQFLTEVPSECDCSNRGLPELGIDFNRCFSIPADELYWRVAQDGRCSRRCRLVSPYLEHLTTRFAAFLSRVALPKPHVST